jgi:large subunit ribosomal protein L16
MPLMPKRVKHRKVQKGANAGLARRNNKIDFGDYALQVLERGRITNNQIEACRVAINRRLNRRGKVWIRVFPSKPITAKPLEVRMGKGKGNVDAWVAMVKPGRVIFELSGCTEAVAREAMALAANKLHLRCRFIARES